MSTSLRNKNINYQEGWFFVTFQVAKNKSLLGAIVGTQCCLNELGKDIEENIKKLPSIYSNVYVDKYVVMPNHIHMVVKLYGSETGGRAMSGGRSGGRAPDPRYNDFCDVEDQGERLHSNSASDKSNIVGERLRPLPQVIGGFKSFTSNLYLKLKKQNKCPDIGSKLWQDSYYDVLVSDHNKLVNIRNYIDKNPENWEQDRFGAVTEYNLGNIDLLNEPLTAFVASEGFSTSKIKCIKKSDLDLSLEKKNPIISTFSSYEERKILHNCLKNKRPFIKVCPGGIPSDIGDEIEKALIDNRCLFLSPIPTEMNINKQRANVCNHYVIKNASEIWTGHIRQGGSLETILKGISI